MKPMILEPLGQLHTLHPGDVVCAERGERMETLLGSCVAIVLTDPRRTLGAMCHIVHASRATAGVAETGAYAEVALDTMYALLRERGIDPRQCEAYVYGGGNMFPQLFNQIAHVGERNSPMGARCTGRRRRARAVPRPRRRYLPPPVVDRGSECTAGHCGAGLRKPLSWQSGCMSSMTRPWCVRR
ncbi:MAG: chemotaxis protein CheD [Burkholderiaceae bacterium]